ncbi:hypothetical protein GCM10010912_07620 [Paenibacillus albidus]|uniref:B12-binding domain-containing protein n=1 Tax=Paenibacillus albidus TaxID=2041023 RepID=A0A917FBH7_9BACL|nr:cobalamin-dependent protein [Paenibacillus albidus]GGF65083.1 hypothetical protein GCM10010912_07620 [Paenibacillus albidus]
MITEMQASAGERLSLLTDRLAERVTAQQYQLQPELMERFGPSGVERTKQDSVYHLRYLAQSVALGSPLLFIKYIIWLRQLLVQYKITGEDLRVNLNLIREALNDQLEPGHKLLVLDYLDMGIHQVDEVEVLQSFLQQEKPYFKEAESYLRLLLAGERRLALEFVLKLHEAGVPIRDIYLHIFQTCQYEVGRLWQTGELTIAQEHYCTASTQSIISHLYPRWITAPQTDRTMVAVGVGDEMHEIGLRMLTDFFEMEGWDTHYLGTNLPDAELIRYLVKQQADVLAVSVTMTYHVAHAQRLIAAIRAEDSLKDIKVLVGGMPFNIEKELWRKVGADGYAPDAKGATEVADKLLSRA